MWNIFMPGDVFSVIWFTVSILFRNVWMGILVRCILALWLVDYVQRLRREKITQQHQQQEQQQYQPQKQQQQQQRQQILDSRECGMCSSTTDITSPQLLCAQRSSQLSTQLAVQLPGHIPGQLPAHLRSYWTVS